MRGHIVTSFLILQQSLTGRPQLFQQQQQHLKLLSQTACVDCHCRCDSVVDQSQSNSTETPRGRPGPGLLLPQLPGHRPTKGPTARVAPGLCVCSFPRHRRSRPHRRAGPDRTGPGRAESCFRGPSGHVCSCQFIQFSFGQLSSDKHAGRSLARSLARLQSQSRRRIGQPIDKSVDFSVHAQRETSEK